MPASAPTLRRLLDDPKLRLRLRAGGQAGLDRVIELAHVSELLDPCPYLEGGELLLTTGLALPPEAAAQQAYVSRLARADVAALGLGTGLTHESLPPALVAAADAVGLPLLQVPHGTPFLAVSKAVSRSHADYRYAAVAATNDAQRALTRAALTGDGNAALVRRLVALVGGWALLTDPAGRLLAASPAGAAHGVADLRALAGSAGVGGPEDVVVQSLGSGRVRGMLAAGRPLPYTVAERQVVSIAASLLTLALATSAQLDAAQGRLRGVLVSLLLHGHVDAAAQAAQGALGGLPPEPLHVAVLAGPAADRLAVADALAAGGGEGGAVLAAELDGELVVLLPDPVPLLRAVGSRARCAVGVSELGSYPDAARLLVQARQAAAAARRGRVVSLSFADMAGEGLLAMVPAGQAAAFARTVLGPVLQAQGRDRHELTASLEAWLEHHGQWDTAAAGLGVHRHTLRRRIARLELLLGRSLDSADVRCELWLALRVLARS